MSRLAGNSNTFQAGTSTSSSSCTSFSLPQHPSTSRKGSLDYTTDSAKPFAGLSAQISPKPVMSQINDSIISPRLISDQSWLPFVPSNPLAQARENLLMTNRQQIQLQLDPSKHRKRAPKAKRMSQERWEPSKNRIKQLYVIEGKNLKELQEIINKEFGFAAT